MIRAVLAWCRLGVVHLGLCVALLLAGIQPLATPAVLADDTVVYFPDANLEAAIRDAIDKPIGDIHESELAGLTQFSAEFKQISNLAGLEHCVNLESLRLSFNGQISDLSPLSPLTNLTSLHLKHNQITDVSPLSSLTNLTSLSLSYNEISDISPLSSLVNLTGLWLRSSSVSDFSPLSLLTNLTVLWLENNRITDVSPLSSLTNLAELQLRRNSISDLSPLSSLTNLTQLGLSSNGISDLSSLSSFTNLTSLSLSSNEISDLSPLSPLTNLTSLHLTHNLITDVSPLSSLTNLTSLSLSHNKISDLSPLSSLVNLSGLWLPNNEISDLSPLSSLANLSNLWLENNEITDLTPLSPLANLAVLWLENNEITDLSPLSSLTNLDQLQLWRNSISDLSALSSLTNLTQLGLARNRISALSPLSSLTKLTWLSLRDNRITDLSPLVTNTGLNAGDSVLLRHNYIDLTPGSAAMDDIQTLLDRGVNVEYEPQYEDPRKGVFEALDLIGTATWHDAGYTGTGVKVGVVAPGFAEYESLLGFALPETVTTYWAPSVGGPGTHGHGTALAEVVYSVAPEADLYFANFDSTSEWEAAIDWFIAQEVDILANSGGFLPGTPLDGSSVFCNRVAEAREAGILYCQTSGRLAQRHWSGSFVDTNSSGWHEFIPELDQGNDLSANAGDPIRLELRWDDEWGASANDYDLFLLYHHADDGWITVAASQNRQTGSQYPLEQIALQAPFTGNYTVAIENYDSDGTANLTLFSYGHDLQHCVAAGSLITPGDAEAALTVGAIHWDSPAQLTPWSSQGPTEDGRTKPDLVAPGDVTTFSGSWRVENAYVAGAAALVKQAYPSYGPDQLQSYLESNAIDLGEPGKNNQFGWGRLWLPPPAEGVGHVVLIEPLEITPAGQHHYPEDELTATFAIKNIGDSAITLDSLTARGRMNSLFGVSPYAWWLLQGMPDFEHQAVTIQPSEVYEYEGKLTFDYAGTYRFHVAYHIENPTPDEKVHLDANHWNTSLDVSNGLSESDRVATVMIAQTPQEPADEIAVLKGQIESALRDNQDRYYPPDLRNEQSFLGQVSVVWTRFSSWLSSVDFFAEYEAAYQAGLDYDVLSFNALVNANRAIVAGDADTARKQLEDYRTYALASDQSFSAAAHFFDGQMSAGAELLDAVREGCQAAVKFGVQYVGGPKAAKVVDYLYTGVDFAIDYWVFGHEEEQPLHEALIDLILEEAITGLFQEVPLPGLGDSTLEDFLTDPAVDVTLSMLQTVLNDEGVEQFLVETVKEACKNEEDAEVLAESIVKWLTDTLTLLQIEDSSPIELRVYDSEDRITGLIDGEVHQDVPRSVYGNEGIFVFFPACSPRCEVIGTDQGTYGLTITQKQGLQSLSCSAEDIPTSAGSIHEYSVDWDAIEQGKRGVTVRVDVDGDGTIDRTISTTGEVGAESFLSDPPHTPNDPSPSDGSIDVSVSTTLSWIGGVPDPEGTVVYDLYLGLCENPPLVAQDLLAASYSPESLRYNATYYWQVVAIDNYGVVTEGPVWSFTTETTGEYSKELEVGWSLISLPVVPDDNSVEAVFGDQIEAIYTWDPDGKSYSVPDAIEPAHGYWVAVAEDTTISVTGVPVYKWTCHIHEGWNVIGSLYEPVGREHLTVTDDPDHLYRDAIYWWNGTSYVLLEDEDELIPGRGYWLASSDSGDVTLQLPPG